MWAPQGAILEFSIFDLLTVFSTEGERIEDHACERVYGRNLRFFSRGKHGPVRFDQRYERRQEFEPTAPDVQRRAVVFPIRILCRLNGQSKVKFDRR